MKHFLDISDCSTATIQHLLSVASQLKVEVKRGVFRPALKNKTLGLLFQKPSTRTRVSFEVGMKQLGGNVLYLQSSDMGLGVRETIPDVSRVLSRYLDAIMIRTFSHNDIEEFADFSSIPVINGLTDNSHPCQALADAFTISEYFDLSEAPRVAYIGDGNNVCISLIEICNKLNMPINVCTPKGYEPKTTGEFTQYHDPNEAVEGVKVLYTDVWTSMGQEEETAKRLKDFDGFMITMDHLKRAHSDAILLHCLPAHRGEEISHEVFESSQSKVFDQAENRMHVQKAILLGVLS
jgi:ornithine carbamoyltransferase